MRIENNFNKLHTHPIKCIASPSLAPPAPEPASRMSVSEDRESARKYARLAQFYAAICEHSSEKHAIVEGILRREAADVNYRISANSFFKHRRPHFLGYTALHFALDEREARIFEILLRRGADFTLKNEAGATVLHQAVESSYYKFKRCWKLKGRQHHPFAELVLAAHVERRVSANPANRSGLTHLHVACMTNHARAVEFFLESGASADEAVRADAPALPGYASLHFAARYGAVDAAEVLLRFGADPRLRDARGMSPLQLLIERNMEIADWMKTGQRADFGRFALDLEDNERMIRLMLEHCEHAGLSPLHVACALPDAALAERLLRRGADPESPVGADSAAWPGYTALHFAAHFDFGLVRLLVSRGASLLAQDAKGVTPFDLCLQRCSAQDLHFLLVSQPSWRGVTLGDGATRLANLVFAMRYSSSLHAFLRERRLGDGPGARVPFDSPIWPGFTPLHLAVLLAERTGDIADLAEDTDYRAREQAPAVYNCSEDEERVYLERVKVCLSLGADVCAQDARGLSPLHLAFRLQKERVARLLLAFHARPANPVDDDGLSHLHVACAARDLRLAGLLLRRGEDANAPLMSSFKWFGVPYYREKRPYVFYISTGSTPLHIAVAAESPELAELLLRHGADLYATDANGLTPIHRALTTRARKDTAGLLTSAPDLRDSTLRGGLSHLHVASFVNNAAAVARLLDAGADIESSVTYRLSADGQGGPEYRDVFVDPYDDSSPEPLAFLAPYSGYTALHFAMQEHCRDVVRLLVERGADVLARRAGGSTPLYATLDCPYSDVANVFARALRGDAGVQRRMLEDIGLTMLHVDCVALSVEGVRERLRAGVDANAQVRSDSTVWPGCTPLHVLMSKSHDDGNGRAALEIVRLLLEHGADVTLMNQEQVTPVHEAYSLFDLYGHPYVDMLLASQRDFSVNPHSVRGISHFHVACIRNNVAVVESFLNHGIDVDHAIDHFSNTLGGYSSLHLATVHDAKQTVELLLARGADVLVEDRIGNTPLHAATEHSPSSLSLIERLISAGADINATNILGETPLEALLTSSDAPGHIVELFLRRGCRVNAFNPISQEGYVAMAFCTDDQHVGAVQRPAFRALLGAPDIADLDAMGRNAIHNIVSTSKKNNSASDYADGIEMLTRMGCDFDQQDCKGRTPLHLAAQFRNFKAIAGLLMCGADVNVRDASGKPAFAYSLERSEERRERDLHIIVTFSMHLLKLQLLELDVDQLNIEVDIEARKKFPFNVKVAERCQAELARLRGRAIEPYSVTLFDFLSETGAVAAYPRMPQVERHAIDEFFYSEAQQLRKEFPELACLLRLQYGRALARLPLMDPATLALTAVLGFELPLLCSDAVLRFLRNEELRNLIAATDEDECDSRKRLRT